MCTVLIKATQFAFHHLRSWKVEKNNLCTSFICTKHVNSIKSTQSHFLIRNTAKDKTSQHLRINRARLRCMGWRWFPLGLCARQFQDHSLTAGLDGLLCVEGVCVTESTVWLMSKHMLLYVSTPTFLHHCPLKSGCAVVSFCKCLS